MYLLFDGGNGGPNVNKGYGSFIIRANKNSPTLHHECVEFTNPMTNNEAEYNTLIYALQWIHDHIDDPEYEYGVLEIEGDSQLIRCQVLGLWQVRELRMKPLRDRVQQLLNVFTRWSYNYIPRIHVVEILGH